MSTAIVAILSVIISLPISYLFMKAIYSEIIRSFSGWLTFYIDPMVYVQMLVLGILAYAVVGALQFRKIKKFLWKRLLKTQNKSTDRYILMCRSVALVLKIDLLFRN